MLVHSEVEGENNLLVVSNISPGDEQERCGINVKLHNLGALYCVMQNTSKNRQEFSDKFEPILTHILSPANKIEYEHLKALNSEEYHYLKIILSQPSEYIEES